MVIPHMVDQGQDRVLFHMHSHREEFLVLS